VTLDQSLNVTHLTMVLVHMQSVTLYIYIKKFQLILQSSNTGLYNFILYTATYPDDHSPVFQSTWGSKSKTRKDIQFRKILS